MDNIAIINSIEDKLLVSCPGFRGGLLYVFGEQQIILSLNASTGIFVDNERLIICSQKDGGRELKIIGRDSFEDIKLSEQPFDLHDVLVRNNNTYVVASESNEVIKYDKGINAVSRWGLPGEPDSAHMNSVAFYQGRLIASIFGRFEKHREYKEGTKKLGQVIDVKTGETLINGLSQPHSLTVVGEYLYLCNSEDKELHVYCGTVLIEKVALPGYARGISVGNKYIYVGISLSRNISETCNQAGGSIAVLSRDTFEIEGVKPIPFSEVYDIRQVENHADYIIKTVTVVDNSGIYEDYENLLKAYDETKSAYDETKVAYDETKSAYDEILKSYRIIIFLSRIFRRIIRKGRM